MTCPLTEKLAAYTDLSEEDRRHVQDLSAVSYRQRAGEDLIREGDRPEMVFLLLEGWAYRYKMLPDGSRQIMAYLIPGDLCDIHVFILKHMDHAIGLLSDARIAAIPKARMLALLASRPAVAEALLWSTLVDEAVLREWLVNIGQRDAYERIAHLFCEMWLRMRQVGLVSGGEYTLPLTQEQLGDTVGLTSVHVNRVLQRMRSDGLIALTAKQLTILDHARLRQVARFDPNYLHLERRS